MSTWPFTDKEACPKCGESFHVEHGVRPDVKFLRGWLKVTCPSCGYYWAEDPVDGERCDPWVVVWKLRDKEREP